MVCRRLPPRPPAAVAALGCRPTRPPRLRPDPPAAAATGHGPLPPRPHHEPPRPPLACRRDASTLGWLASAQYRGGRFEDAARKLQEAIRIHGQGGYVGTWLFLAMAHKRLGRHDEARKDFEKFAGWFDKQRFQSWQER